MRASLVLLGLGLATVAGAPSETPPHSIVGGNLTTIEQYPFQVALLFGGGLKFQQGCAGSIINNRSVLTAAHCVRCSLPKILRVRVGSSFANSGGVVHKVEKIIVQNGTEAQLEKDLAIVRLATPISFSKQAKPATLPDANYNLGDNQTVWAAGWGDLTYGGSSSEQLRHVQIWTVNQDVCKDHYGSIGNKITDDMLCAGWLGVGGRGTCQGDSGGPLVHNGVVVGVTSWGKECGLRDYPGVYARVSRAYDWIQANA